MAESALTEKQEQQIREALEECVVIVRAGRSTGTGFFVAAEQVLTCRHVIEPSLMAPGRAPISLTYGPGHPTRAGQELAATLWEDPPPAWPDVAILTAPGAASARCVVIDSGPVTRGTPLLTAGYPAKAEVPYQVQHYTAGDPGILEGNHRLLRISDDVVTPGMSGSPVVNLRTGLVCGILGITKGSTSALGGFAALFADFIDQFPYLGVLDAQPPPKEAQAWVRIVGGLLLKNVGRAPTGARWGAAADLTRLDVELEQGPDDVWGKWQISVRPSLPGQTLHRFDCKISDLGDGVMRAVDGWSRRHTIKLQDEVDDLGDVLHQAMLPKEAREALADVLNTRDLLFRVCVDKAPRLSQLPWEYARGTDREPIAAVRNKTFSRFVDVVDRSPEPKDKIRVLAVIECPGSISEEFPTYYEKGKEIHLTANGFADTIRRNEASRRERIEIVYLINQPQTVLENKLGSQQEGKPETQWDIVHYIGFAVQGEEEQDFSIALGGGEDWRTIPVGDLKDLLDIAGCSVFIAEFHKLAPGQNMVFPTDLSGLTSLLRSDYHNHPQALIVTQYPMDLADLSLFNDTFYERISVGRTVEQAVQFGRSDVRNQTRLRRDVAAFGSFVVTTTRAAGVRLLGSTEQGRPRPYTGALARGDGAETGQGPDAEPAQGAETGESPGMADELIRLRAEVAQLKAQQPQNAGPGAPASDSPAWDRPGRTTG
jgi:hypothetical protein